MDKVSVIIATYRRSTRLPQAIQSVLDQSYPNIELIVVDDNGENSIHQAATAKVMAAYLDKYKNIKFIKHKKNLGQAAANNTAIRAAKGTFIAFLDDDDVYHESKIEKQVKILSSHPLDYGAIYCGYRLFDDEKLIEQTELYPEGNLQIDILSLNYNRIRYNTSTLLFRNLVFKDLNGFDEEYRRHTDYELQVRFFRKYKICAVYEHLVDRYVDENSNLPSPCQLIEIKRIFLNKLREDINRLPDNTKQLIFLNHCKEVVQFFAWEEKIEEARGFIFENDMAKQYSKLLIQYLNELTEEKIPNTESCTLE